MRKLFVPAATALPATVALAVALVLRPGDGALAVDAYVLFLGAATLALLVRATTGALPQPAESELEGRLREKHPEPERVTELARLERVVALSTQSAFDAYYRLRPTLREIAAHRLGRRGVDLDGPGPAAEQLLGPEAWRIVRPGVPRPADHFAPGLDLAAVRAAVEALERI